MVAHALGLRVLRASIAPTGGAYAFCDIAPFGTTFEGTERMWLLRFAITLYAGVAGNACVGPVSGATVSTGHCKSDHEAADSALRRAGLDPGTAGARFSFHAWELVGGGRACVYALALSLLRAHTICRDDVVETIDRSFAVETSRRLEVLRRFLLEV
jgi:hypothetical protein